jgi:hypothetical protein
MEMKFMSAWVFFAVLLASSSSEDANYVTVPQAPRVILHGTEILVTFKCSWTLIIGVELRVDTEFEGTKRVFSTKWWCRPTAAPEERLVVINLPDELAFYPDRHSGVPMVPERCMFVAWMLDREDYLNTIQLRKDYFDVSQIRLSYEFSLPLPFDRPHRPGTSCPHPLETWKAPYNPASSWQPGENMPPQETPL